MALKLKPREDDFAAVAPGAAPAVAFPLVSSPVRVADAEDAPVVAPVHRQHERLRAEFAEPEKRESYSGPVKLAILVVTPVLGWAAFFTGAVALSRIFAP